MIRKLITLANDLDKKGLRKEADYLDKLIKRYAKDENYSKGTLYTPEAVKELFPEGDRNPLTPKGFKTFYDHWKHFWTKSDEDRKSMPWPKYQTIAKEMNPKLEKLEDIIDDKDGVYFAPIPFYVE